MNRFFCLLLSLASIASTSLLFPAAAGSSSQAAAIIAALAPQNSGALVAHFIADHSTSALQALQNTSLPADFASQVLSQAGVLKNIPPALQQNISTLSLTDLAQILDTAQKSQSASSTSPLLEKIEDAAEKLVGAALDQGVNFAVKEIEEETKNDKCCVIN